jgi:hypothetical protein
MKIGLAEDSNLRWVSPTTKKERLPLVKMDSMLVRSLEIVLGTMTSILRIK